MRTRGRRGESPVKELEHPALLYSTLDEFLAYMVPFVADGLANDEPVFVAVGEDELAALSAEFGPDAARVRWADTREWHPATATRLRAFHELVSEELMGGAARVRLVGEPVWPAGPPELVREWQRYESVLNEVLGPFPVTLACTYDMSRLDPSIVDTARRTHPLIRRGTKPVPAAFEEPARFLRRWSSELPPPPPWASRMREPFDLSAARRFLRDHARGAGLSPERATDLCVAANEILTNALVHGGGILVALSAWAEDGRFVCQIEDGGRGISDSLAGYRPPRAAATGGRGLWLARQLVDLLQIAPGPGSVGTKVRLHI